MKLTVEVTNKELDDLEDLIMVWNLCQKHKSIMHSTEKELFNYAQTCKKCVKINKEIKNKTLHLWSKLVTAYMKATKKKI
ncbi:MAG: hypothetical protein Q7K42_02675 [Candidatus Diapherotrites archaeon]|nr:hypothetical protein [Candidatus Diapherotrites archaeon]